MGTLELCKRSSLAVLIPLLAILFFALLGTQVLGVEAPKVDWERTFGGNDADLGYSIQQTADGGYIIAGVTHSYGSGKSDVYLIKTDALGNKLWERTFGGSDWDSANGIAVDGSGNAIVGNTRSYGAGWEDAYLIKTDSQGNKVWEKTFGGSGSDVANSGQLTSDGGYILAGGTTSYGVGGEDVLLVKTNSFGDFLWQRTFGGAGSDLALFVQQVSDGGYVITGMTNSYGAGGWDMYLIKTESQGNKIWEKTFGGSGTDVANCVQQVADGGYIITGYSYSPSVGDSLLCVIKTDNNGNKLWEKHFGRAGSSGQYIVQSSDGGYVITGNSEGASSDVYVLKIDAQGNKTWEMNLGGSGGDRGYSIQQTADGGYIIAGVTMSERDDLDVYLAKLKPESRLHTVSTPTTPSGSSSGQVGDSLGFSAGGATCSQGHSVQYRFDWGNGDYSNWSSSTSASYRYLEEDTYLVRAQARCATDTPLESSWSGAKIVSIEEALEPVETVIGLAKAVLGAPYLWGGKGLDLNERQFVPQEAITTDGYNHWNPSLGEIDLGKGLDCSGLTYWAYNRVYYGESTVTAQQRLVYYEGADGQYRGNTRRILKGELIPGDLLFFNVDKDLAMDHVAMYIGDFLWQSRSYNSIHASGFTATITPAVYEASTETLTTQEVNGMSQVLQVSGYGRVKSYQVEARIIALSPIELLVVDPEGNQLSREVGEIPGMYYMVYDYDGDGSVEEIIAFSELKAGDYKVSVLPKHNASPTDTYSLKILTQQSETYLAKNIQVQDIPEEPYEVDIVGDGTPPVVDTLVLGPNPVPDTGTAFFYSLPVGTSTAKLMVLSATSGRLLFETSIDVNETRFPATGTWDPVDNDGVRLANGPYLYVLIANGQLIGQGKMVIQR